MAIVDTLSSVFSMITPTGMSPVLFWGAFVIIYGISFSALMKLNLFQDNRRLVAVVSFVIAMMVAISPVVSQVLSTSMPSLGIIIVFLVCLLLAANIISPGWSLGNKSSNYAILAIFIILGIVFISGIVGDARIAITSTHVDFFGAQVARADLEVVIAVVVIGIFIYLISSSVTRGGDKK